MADKSNRGSTPEKSGSKSARNRTNTPDKQNLNTPVSEVELDRMLTEVLKTEVEFDESRFEERLKKRLEESTLHHTKTVHPAQPGREILIRLREIFIFNESSTYRTAAVAALFILPVLYTGFADRGADNAAGAGDAGFSPYRNQERREIVPAIPTDPDRYETIQVAPRTLQVVENGPPRFNYETQLIEEMDRAAGSQRRLSVMKKLRDYYDKTGQWDKLEEIESRMKVELRYAE